MDIRHIVRHEDVLAAPCVDEELFRIEVVWPLVEAILKREKETSFP